MPWGRYVTHSAVPRAEKAKPSYGAAKETEPKQWFITVRHVHWWPPFADYDVTYRSFYQKTGLYSAERYWWASEVTGRTISNERDGMLTAMVMIADTRFEETEEMLKGTK